MLRPSILVAIDLTEELATCDKGMVKHGDRRDISRVLTLEQLFHKRPLLKLPYFTSVDSALWSGLATLNVISRSLGPPPLHYSLGPPHLQEP